MAHIRINKDNRLEDKYATNIREASLDEIPRSLLKWYLKWPSMLPNELDFIYLFVMSFINRRRSDLRFILSEVLRYVCPTPRLVRARCNFSINGEQEFRLYQISSNSRDNHNIRLNLSSGPFTTLSRAQDPRHPSTSISILKNCKCYAFVLIYLI